MKISDDPRFEAGFEKGCAACHASCGDCHISQPKNVGGGLISGHRINRTPDQQRNCTACHGSRVGDEFTGANSYAGASQHFLKRIQCVDCHGGDEMHGTPGETPKHRYEEKGLPTCRDCHDDIEPSSWHVYHASENSVTEGRNLQCQVCHSQDYKSCNSCHVGEGITGSSYQTFKIGKNPIKDLNGWDYALLRHIPIAEDTYTGWGLTDLANYSDVETWKYTSPHNIRRFTARTDTTGGKNGCADCHGTEDSPQGWFLRASDLAGLPPAEQDANQHVIVPDGNAMLWPE
jgi:thiosulfate/3-mercaptopyruvate sulfurtransferase